VLAELGGRPMLRFMLDRLGDLAVDELVVATSELERDDPVAALADGAGVAVVRGSEADVLSRYATALSLHPADHVVRLTADCPLVDPAIVAAAVELHLRSGADYTCNVLPRTYPKGLDVEVARATALLTAAEEAVDPPEREHVTPFLYRHPERFVLANLRSGDDLGAERWTVDTAADLELVRRLVERLGPNEPFGWREVLRVAGRTSPAAHPGLRLRVARAADSDQLLAWRNDPAAVAWSVSGRAVGRDEHEQWFSRRLDDPATRIWVAERDGTPVASTRIDVHDAIGEVSIVVAPDERGRGTGSDVLGLLQQELEGDFQVIALDAVVHPENEPSVRMFEHAGFVPSQQRGAFAVLRWATMDGRKEESP
jgi:spore coat polysaccharide biosynthesis protein SpsF